MNEALTITGQIVAAFVSKNAIPAGDVGKLITDVAQAIGQAATGEAVSTVEPVEQKPAVNPKKSVHDDFIICLEDGKKFKSLKRHLMTHFQLTPDAYRTKWGLAADYPMVAPNYAAARSTLAKSMGLGRKPGARPVLRKVA